MNSARPPRVCGVCHLVITKGEAFYLWPVPGGLDPTEGVDICRACWPAALREQERAGVVVPVQPAGRWAHKAEHAAYARAYYRAHKAEHAAYYRAHKAEARP